MKYPLFALLFAAATPAAAVDQSLDRLDRLNQSQFNAFADELSAALSYKPLLPAEPLGVLGFDVGVEASATELQNPQLFSAVNDRYDFSDYLLINRLRVHKGLPGGIDVGGYYGKAPSSNIATWGLEGRYALIEGNTLMPALAARAAYTQMSGVDVVDFSSQSLELTISKGFVMFTPYAGIGYVWSQVEPNAAHLSTANPAQEKIYAGVNVAFTLISILGEVDWTGGVPTYSAKIALRF